VRSTSDNSALRGARQEDLVRILDELDNRTQRLDDEKRRLENQRTELENSSNQAEEARKQTEQKAQQLGVLAGTVAAQGPGITLTISDPKGTVESDTLLDTLQELRAAGAEAIEINGVRVVADTYFTQSGSSVEINGKKISQPYSFKVIGNPQDLEPALNIPGGVVQTLEKERPQLMWHALRRSSWTPCGRRRPLTTLSRHHRECGARRVRGGGRENAGGRRLLRVVREGNCVVGRD
jgi:uncharacterized protein YlxW (UPF0749 family)